MTRRLPRWLGGALWLTMVVAGRPAQAQSINWARGFAPNTANVPAPVTWLRPVEVDESHSQGGLSAAVLPLQVRAASAVAEETPVDPFPERLPARLGAPVALPAMMPVADGLQPVQYVLPLSRREGNEDFAEAGLLPTTIQLTLPGPHRLFRLESEAAVHERIRQEARQTRTPTLIEFPEQMRFEEREKVYVPRQWPLTKELVQPCYVFHGRLLFEQPNSERYGWSMGVAQPAISALHFYADVATLPYHLAQDPCRYGDTSAGKCLPGDPVPLYLYPPQWSLSGLTAEAAAVTLLFFVFP